MKNIKTLGQLLQEIVENEDKRFSLCDFLTDSSEEERKEVEKKLNEKAGAQFHNFMDGFSFVSEDEIRAAVCEYHEKVMNRAISMGEMLDLENVIDDYINTRGLNFED